MPYANAKNPESRRPQTGDAQYDADGNRISAYEAGQRKDAEIKAAHENDDAPEDQMAA